MKYLQDTDIASYYLRGKYNLINVFNRELKNIKVSIITVSELKVLAFKNPKSNINLVNIQNLEKKLGILNLNQETWDIFAKTKAQLLKNGKPKGDFDILQASIAKQNELVLVTNNISHYIDLVEIENWIRR
jgi:tRNA(fMet)-specific endonuclease VapC